MDRHDGRPEAATRFPLLGRVLAVVCIAVAGWLLTRQLEHVQWSAVVEALQAFTPGSLVVAVVLAATSHALYASYELIGRRLTRHGVPVRRTLAIGAISYAFNLNLGTLIGGFATRYRLYANAGLEVAQTVQVIGVSVVTNWSGYCALAGTVLVWRPPPLPDEGVLAGLPLRAIGVLLLAIAAAYVIGCALAPGRRLAWRGHALTTPSARVALLQLVLSAANWATIATLVWWLLQRPVEWSTVLGVFLLAAVAGIVVRVPAGLGVIEAVFLAMLGDRVPPAALLAGLIVHRVVYYLVPLAFAGTAMLWLEHRHRRDTSAPAAPEPVNGPARPRAPAPSEA